MFITNQPTNQELQLAFERCIEKNRKGNTLIPCPREALFDHAFFVDDDDVPPPTFSIVPAALPFERVWVVTSYKGMGLVALVERMGPVVRPDYMVYPVPIAGKPSWCTDEDFWDSATFIVDKAIHKILTNDLEEVESEVRARMNRGLSKIKNPPTNELPAFIHVSHTARNSVSGAGTHASPQPHDRRGHWRYYKTTGKRVWINETKVLGGSPVPRNYVA